MINGNLLIILLDLNKCNLIGNNFNTIFLKFSGLLSEKVQKLYSVEVSFTKSSFQKVELVNKVNSVTKSSEVQ